LLFTTDTRAGRLARSAAAARFACLLASSEATARAHEAGPIEQRVEDLLMQWLRTNPCAEQVAERLGLSVRTLHRQLSARGNSFRALIERTRHCELDLLQQTEQLHTESAGGPALTAGERARMLGFSNAGALRNALRRWAGRS
jgi:AraC-like DNA-binding protein